MEKADKIKELNELFEKGLLTEKEFTDLKSEIIHVPPHSFVKKETFQDNSNNDSSDTFYYWKRAALVVIVILIIAFVKDYSNDVSGERPVLDEVNNEVTDENSSTVFNVCNVCNREFTGHGFTEVSDGVWKRVMDGSQSSICSPNCGLKATQHLIDAASKYGVNLEENNNSNSLNYGSDGRLYESNACGLCNGTGIEKGKNFATGEMEGRICPMCDGRGVRSY